MPSPALKLPATSEKFVAAQVEQGAYRSREAAIVAAVTSEKMRTEQRHWLRAEIQKGLDSGPAGPLDRRRHSARPCTRRRTKASPIGLMPSAIELSELALADFDHIYDSIAKHNPRAAAKALRDLDAAIQHLSDQRNMGRAYRHGRHRLRLLAYGNYLVFYRNRPGVIEVIRILDGRQNFPDILDEL